MIQPVEEHIRILLVEGLPGEACSIEDMLARADALMYRQKAERKKSRG